MVARHWFELGEVDGWRFWKGCDAGGGGGGGGAIVEDGDSVMTS